MEFTKEKLNLEEGLKKEWIITNGMGGYSASTIIGANTRKYHGLLVAPLTPPARRFLILSKLDESIEFEGKKNNLYTNVCNEHISDGFKYQQKFRKIYLPIFTYKVEDIKITKIICMQYGKNTVGVYYKIMGGEKRAKLTLAPIMNFRDFHTVNTDHQFELRQEVRKGKIKVVVDRNSQTPIYMHISEGEYIMHENDTFHNMFYIEEEKRGFCAEENHIVPGRYEIDIEPKQEKEISFVCSLEENIEEIDVKELINEEIVRLGEIFNNSLLIDLTKQKKSHEQLERDSLVREFLIAADNFIVYRPNFRLHTMIAGYPWFLDWGRDSLISFEGILLVTKRFDIAREILLTMTRDIKFGLVPNGYSGYDNRPLYNSVDASLLLFEQIQKYIDYTGDYKFVKEKLYKKLEDIIENYCNGIDVDNNNIYLDKDGLIVSGTEETQNTWMDAKYDGIAITPRNGKAVEINSMWYNANMIMASLTSKMGSKAKVKKYKELAENCRISFNNKFYNEKKKSLYDVIGDDKIRPNQLFAFSLTYPIIDLQSEIAKNVINTVEEKLLNDFGLKTLAKGEKNYVEIYEGNGEKRDKSYHQGITWPWLLGLYYNTLKNQKKSTKSRKEKTEIENKIKEFSANIEKTFTQELCYNGCVGNIAEIYDSSKPQLPKGTFAQAWSVAEVFRIILRK